MDWEFDAIGTRWCITAVKPITDDTKQAVIERIMAFDWSYSRFRDDGLIATIRARPGTYVLPADAEPLLSWYWQLYDVTDGGLTPLVGRTLEQLGYDAAYSLQPGDVDNIPTWEQAMDYLSPVLTVHLPDVVLDFGAAGKGYLVDIVAELLGEHEHQAFVINAGGDIRVMGQTLRVELEDPYDSTRSLGYVELQSGQAICASATNRRRWAGVHHVIDPHTRQPTDAITASWVIAESCMQADGIATALWFTAPELLAEQFRYEYLLIRGDTMQSSAKFGARLYTGDLT